MKPGLITFTFMLFVGLRTFADSNYVAERLHCTHRSYLLLADGGKRQVSESNFHAQIKFEVNGHSRQFFIDRHRWAPKMSYTRAMETLNPALPRSAPTTDQVTVGNFVTNSRGARVSSRSTLINRGRSYGSTIIREKVAVSVDSKDISIAVKERLTERWAGDETYIRSVTCRFTNTNEADVFLRATQ